MQVNAASKALTACIAGLLFHKLRLNISSKANRSVRVVIGGIVGEALMVLGYFLFEAGLAAFASGSFSSAALATGIASSVAGLGRDDEIDNGADYDMDINCDVGNVDVIFEKR